MVDVRGRKACDTVLHGYIYSLATLGLWLSILFQGLDGTNQGKSTYFAKRERDSCELHFTPVYRLWEIGYITPQNKSFELERLSQ